MNFGCLVAVCLTLGLPSPQPAPETPWHEYLPPQRATVAGAPAISSFTEEAGPDQSFLLVGQRWGNELAAWGTSPDAAQGRPLAPKVHFVHDGVLAATLPESALDGPVVVWARNTAGWSEPVVLNAPNPWWCSPETVSANSIVRIFGRNLARRPDFSKALVYLASPGRKGIWLPASVVGKYELRVEIPGDVEPGAHQLWVHAGKGGKYGWGGPLPLVIRREPAAPVQHARFERGSLQEAVDQLASRGGGVLRLPAGEFVLPGTLVLPAKVTLQGAHPGRTMLQASSDPSARFRSIADSAWNQGPGGVHSVGDRMVYKVAFPVAGKWNVWLRYATDMKPWNQPGVSKNMTLAADGGPAVALDHLPNTGSFGTFQWSKSAVIELGAGPRELVWKNVRGGGIHIDAFVFALDSRYTPSDRPPPSSGDRVVVVQAEDVTRFETREGNLPGADAAAVWLAGDGAGLRDLTICGNGRTNLGIAVRSSKYPEWIQGCRVVRVEVRDVEGRQAENCGIRLFHADGAAVRDSEVWGRTPIFLSGIQRSEIRGNRLVAATRYGGNAEAYLQGRNEVVRKCILEDNVCACAPGMEGGGATNRRLIWLSTGRGSVDLNWIANNREDRARFAGVAGTDQNVGEMILFEACQRYAYFGPLAAADRQSVTLPARLPKTPDDRLGSVHRKQLAHDAQGNETPFWPPDADQGDDEAVVTEYFVTVLRGAGLGQTRRVVARRGETYLLDRPWRVAPEPGGLVLVHTAYYRNHLIGNRTVDGMTGIQLWIACIENVLCGNVVQRQRKPALYLYGTCTTLASSMPMSWNRGIGPLYFNHVEGTRADETSCGALVVSGDTPSLPVEFPRCLGNVLRHNSFTRNRTDGVALASGRPVDEKQPTSSILGTIVEFNLVRDAQIGYHVTAGAEATLLRRNHCYFWYPVTNRPTMPVAFQIDREKAAATLELNSPEGIDGGEDGSFVPEQRGPNKPSPRR